MVVVTAEVDAVMVVVMKTTVDETEVYEEMRPFISMIKKQHMDILNHAQMRQEFTANVSHELKTPLTAISGYAELIASGMTGGEDTAHFANEIHKSAERLQYLINDIIKLSELDSDDTKIEFETLDLHEMALNCQAMMEIPAEKNEVTVEPILMPSLFSFSITSITPGIGVVYSSICLRRLFGEYIQSIM